MEPIPSSLFPSHGSRSERDKVPSILVVRNKLGGLCSLIFWRLGAWWLVPSPSHPRRQRHPVKQTSIGFVDVWAITQLLTTIEGHWNMSTVTCLHHVKWIWIAVHEAGKRRN